VILLDKLLEDYTSHIFGNDLNLFKDLILIMNTPRLQKISLNLEEY